MVGNWGITTGLSRRGLGMCGQKPKSRPKRHTRENQENELGHKGGKGGSGCKMEGNAFHQKMCASGDRPKNKKYRFSKWRPKTNKALKSNLKKGGGVVPSVSILMWSVVATLGSKEGAFPSGGGKKIFSGMGTRAAFWFF